MEHIFISHHSADRWFSGKLRQDFEEVEFKVWVDAEEISGNYLETIARGIEQWGAFIICMSSEYQASPDCRMEAEYAYSKGKPVIPVITEQGFKPTGWLGLLVAGKVNYDLTGEKYYASYDLLMRTMLSGEIFDVKSLCFYFGQLKMK